MRTKPALPKIRQLLALVVAAVAGAMASSPLLADCDEFIKWSSQTLDSYQREHRLYPLSKSTKVLAAKVMPALTVTEDSWRPIDFDAYLASARLYRSDEKAPIAKGADIAGAIAELSRQAQCSTWLSAPDQPAAESAPVYVQAYEDKGPTGEPGWLYLKYNYIFDWSGLATRRSRISKLGSALTGGNSDRWHRLDVHTAATVGLDAQKRVRTLTLQQHNNKRTHVAGIDFDPDHIRLAAAYQTNELYLDTGATERQSRRAVMSFQQWPYLIDDQHKTKIWQIDEFDGHNSGGHRVVLHPVFIEPDHPLAAYAGLLAPRKRLLGLYIGRDGPPGYDFDGPMSFPESTVIGFWHEGDQRLLRVLEGNLGGFQDTNWDTIAHYLHGNLAAALNQALTSLPDK